MSRLLIILIITVFISCNNDSNADSQSSSSNQEIILPTPPDTIINEELDISIVIQNLPLFDKDTLKIALTSETVRDNNKNFSLSEVDDAFYTKYIQENSDFNPKTEGKKGFETKHYYYGRVQSNSGNHLIIIYEYLMVNHSEDKLFLMSIDREGNLIDNLQISEFTYYPGATLSIRSEIIGDALNLTNQWYNYQPYEYDSTTNKHVFYSDSVSCLYHYNPRKGYELIKSDTSVITRIED